MSTSIHIVDHGRGPQLPGSRITVLDVFYYLERGYALADIQRAIPSLSCDEYEAVVAYVATHRDELIERDRQAEGFMARGVAAQQAKGGIFAPSAEDLTTSERVARLKEKLQREAAF